MKLGLIAGNGRFPFLVLEAAREQGHQVTVIATKGEAFKDLDEAAGAAGAAIHWISIGEIGTCIRLLKDAGTSHAVMAGQVKHTKIFGGGIRPDATAMAILATLPFRNTDGLIGAVAAVLRKNGIELIDSTSPAVTCERKYGLNGTSTRGFAAGRETSIKRRFTASSATTNSQKPRRRCGAGPRGGSGVPRPSGAGVTPHPPGSRIGGGGKPGPGVAPWARAVVVPAAGGVSRSLRLSM